MLNCIFVKAPTPSKSFPVSGFFLWMMYQPAGWYAFRNAALSDSLRTVLTMVDADLGRDERDPVPREHS